jgi:hypothetical protein
MDYYSLSFFFSHLARAPRAAISVRFSGDNFLARASPPAFARAFFVSGLIPMAPRLMIADSTSRNTARFFGSLTIFSNSSSAAVRSVLLLAKYLSYRFSPASMMAAGASPVLLASSFTFRTTRGGNAAAISCARDFSKHLQGSLKLQTRPMKETNKSNIYCAALCLLCLSKKRNIYLRPDV